MLCCQYQKCNIQENGAYPVECWREIEEKKLEMLYKKMGDAFRHGAAKEPYLGNPEHLGQLVSSVPSKVLLWVLPTSTSPDIDRDSFDTPRP